MKKLLIANRGEIALRIIRSCREMNISPVAIYSEADIHSPHVALADEAYCVGPASSSESYLNTSKILDIIKTKKIDLCHPGYGFLSEQSAFAKAVEKLGCIWVGPSPECIDLMGDKIRSRDFAEKAGVPMTKGSPNLKSVEDAKIWAEKTGLPILLKARAGGGGKGMRFIDDMNNLPNAYNMAQSEAQKAFNNPEVYLEKCLVHARHVEVQVFGCSDGRILILGTRDCSSQRRHQKVIEEAPAFDLSKETQEKMAETSTALAKAANYKGAGTIEYLLDKEQNFYFLEMNTRLQVEHPVTEEIYGVDLVRMQILTALKQDAELSLGQARGHSIEVRLYAEDPDNQFFPSPGPIHHIRWPQGPGVRIDSGVYPGQNVGMDYDPMLAKIIVTAPNREQAILRMNRALNEVQIVGLKTNIEFLKQLMVHNDFVEGTHYTTFIEEHMPFNSANPSETHMQAAILSYPISAQSKKTAHTNKSSETNGSSPSLWWKSGITQ